MPTWCWVDVLIVGLLILSVTTGLVRGFVKELIALASWVVGIWLAFNYYQIVAIWLGHYIHDPVLQKIVAVVLIVLVTIIFGSIINAIVRLILHSTGLSGTDRLLGLIFGFLRGVFIVSLLILVTQMTSIITPQAIRCNSILYPYFDPMIECLSIFTPKVMEQIKILDGNTLPEASPKS